MEKGDVVRFKQCGSFNIIAFITRKVTDQKMKH